MIVNSLLKLRAISNIKMESSSYQERYTGRLLGKENVLEIFYLKMWVNYMSVLTCENPVSSVIYDRIFLHVCSTPTKSWLTINRQTEGFGWGRQLKEWGQHFFHLTCIVLVLTQYSVGNTDLVRITEMKKLVATGPDFKEFTVMSQLQYKWKCSVYIPMMLISCGKCAIVM